MIIVRRDFKYSICLLILPALSMSCAPTKMNGGTKKTALEIPAEPEPEPEKVAVPVKKPKTADVAVTIPEIKKVAVGLDNLRYDIPCNSAVTKDFWPLCSTSVKDAEAFKQKVVLGGDPSKTYVVELRVRGIVEPMVYIGGKTNGNFSEGGTPENISYNIFQMTVSEPEMNYFFNAKNKIEHDVEKLDYTVKIRMKGGATVNYFASSQDPTLFANYRNLVIPGIEIPTSLATGQYVQLNTISVEEEK